jgi:hypothetical protein
MTAGSPQSVEETVESSKKPAQPTRKKPAKSNPTAAPARAETLPEATSADANQQSDSAPVATVASVENLEREKKPTRKPRQRGAKSSPSVAAETPAQLTTEAPVVSQAPVDIAAPKRSRRTRPAKAAAALQAPEKMPPES